VQYTDPEVYYYTSGTLNGLHGTMGTENRMLNGLHGTIGTVNGTLNGLHGTVQTENGTLNSLHGTIRTKNGWNGLNALVSISKYAFRKLSLFIIFIITIYLYIYKHYEISFIE
jgi:hypothetical protein